MHEFGPESSSDPLYMTILSKHFICIYNIIILYYHYIIYIILVLKHDYKTFMAGSLKSYISAKNVIQHCCENTMLYCLVSVDRLLYIWTRKAQNSCAIHT